MTEICVGPLAYEAQEWGPLHDVNLLLTESREGLNRWDSKSADSIYEFVTVCLRQIAADLKDHEISQHEAFAKRNRFSKIWLLLWGKGPDPALTVSELMVEVRQRLHIYLRWLNQIKKMGLYDEYDLDALTFKVAKVLSLLNPDRFTA